VVGLYNAIPAHAMAPTKGFFLPMQPMAYAQRTVHNEVQFKCLVQLWNLESHWNHKSKNKQPVYQIRDGKRVALHAYGIAQLLGEKSKDPVTQINHGLKYIKYRYGNSCQALSWHKRHYWY